jgi:hypothetical protein
MNAYINGASDSIFDPPFLAQNDEDRPLTLLELGSGTGVVSAQCVERLSTRQYTVITTDLPEVCPLLKKNLSQYIAPQNTLASLLIRPLAWGNYEHACAILRELTGAADGISPSSHPGPDILTHIICSDLVCSSSPWTTQHRRAYRLCYLCP